MIILGIIGINAIYSQAANRNEKISIKIEINRNIQKISDSVRIYNDGCCEGYTLIGTMNGPDFSDVKLVNMKGKTVNKWNNIFPFPAKMFPDGEILVGKHTESSTHNEGDIKEVTQLDWEGNVIWNFSDMFEYGNGKSARQHHDFQRQGNPVGYYAPGQNFIPQGNTLILGHVDANNSEITNKTLQDDVIYEVDWEGNSTGFIWYANEHFDEFGFSKEAKESIYKHPGLSRPNVWWWWIANLQGFKDNDLFHINSVSRLGKNKWYEKDPINYSIFNPNNLIIDSRHANFIVIIDYDTGSIVWKVGPDYSSNTAEGKKIGQIVGPHNAHMIPKGLPGEGNILVFDNGGAAGYGRVPGQPNKYRNYSRVIEFNPVTLDVAWEYENKKTEKIGLSFLLCSELIKWGKNHHFYSPYISSAQRLPNGNTMITEGYAKRVFEVSPEKEIVWDYFRFRNKGIFYRAYRIPPDWVLSNPSSYDLWEK